MSGRFFHARQSSELLPEHAGKYNVKPASATKKRGVLHERTPSDLNRENGEQQPTIRLVDSSATLKNVYNKNPFPHMPSQVLQPSRISKHGYTIQQDEGSSTFDTKSHDKLQPPSGAAGRLSPQPLNPRYSSRLSNLSESTTTSNADTVFNDSLF